MRIGPTLKVINLMPFQETLKQTSEAIHLHPDEPFAFHDPLSFRPRFVKFAVQDKSELYTLKTQDWWQGNLGSRLKMLLMNQKR